ncbi:MAG: MoxR family ATPase [Chitinophagaceae bacterium]|nr:MAG: MoxR family ATPase [Chitinophagaceae bacterium]
MNNRDIELTSIELNRDPGNYYADEDLVKAVELAIALNKPLLLSGEPGTGKTQLAYYVAWKLAQQTKGQPFGFAEKPLLFNTKSASTATDLFYNYDAVSHFRTKDTECDASRFIELRALGLAIAMKHGRQGLNMAGLSNVKQVETLPEAPLSTVVLIDEIDKAPRDFPNDLLNEMENGTFDIREMNATIPKAENKARILVIMTSNSEKNLPNAFLRRCVYYNIPFPDEKKLALIVTQRLTNGNEQYDAAIESAIKKFQDYRTQSVNKKPATSEFLEWINVLKHYDILTPEVFNPVGSSEKTEKYKASLHVLFKHKEDLEKLSR